MTKHNTITITTPIAISRQRQQRETAHVAATPAAGALASLAALATALNGVDTAGRRRPFRACRCCNSRVEKATAPGCSGSSALSPKTAAAGPSTRSRSSAALSASATTTSCSASTSCPSASRCPTSRSCPTQGFEWQEQWAVNLKCLDGADAGIEVVFKTTTVGGIQAIVGLIDAVRDRLNGGQHDGKVVADRASREGLLPAPPVRQDWFAGADHRRLDAAERPGAGAGTAAAADVAVAAARRAAASPARRMMPMST